MRKHPLVGVALCLAASALLTACSEANSESAGKADTAADAAAITASETAQVADMKAGDVEKTLAHYSSTARFMTPNTMPVKGTDALRAQFRGMLGDPGFSLDFKADKTQVAASGDMAYTHGTYTLRFTDPKAKKVMQEKGDYLTVWQKSANGSWRIIEDVTAPYAPAAPTA